MKLNLDIFKFPGSYAGFLVGLILVLQIKSNRMFLLEGSQDFNFFTITNIIFLMIAGFVIGGLINKKIITKKKEKL